MRARVKLSGYCLWLTVIITAAFVVGCVLTFHEIAGFCIILVMALVMIVSGLIYAPITIEANPKDVLVRSLLRRKQLPISDIESVKLFQPTMGAIRVCASGGYMGYWGIFREGDIGKYYAYYGKSSDCFLVTMKTGAKYVLGCENPRAMVDYINSLIIH